MPRPSLLLRLAAVLALLVSTQSALFVRGLFEVRHSYIAEHLCEDRHDPDSDCDGSCVLKRQMAAHDHHGDEKAPQAVMTAPVVVALLAPSATVPPDRWHPRAAPNPGAVLAASSGAREGVFHPPRQG